MKRVLAAAIVLGTAIAAAAAGDKVTADPDVSWILLPPSVAGSGSSVKISNTGTTTINNAKIVPSTCGNGVGWMGVNGQPIPSAFAAGSSFMVQATCTATTTAGMRRCSFGVDDSGGSELASFLGVCMTGSSATMSVMPPGAIDFGDVTIGTTSSTKTVTLTTVPITGGTLSLQTDNYAVFHVDAPAPCNDTGGCDIPVTATQSAFQISLTCHPQAAQLYTAHLLAVSSVGDAQQMPVTLTCNGVAGSGPTIGVSASSLDLGSVEVLSGSASQTLSVTNTGTGTLLLTAIDLSDSGDGAAMDYSYTISGTCAALPCNLGAGASAVVAVTFDPSQLFMRSATLTIHSSDTAHPTTAIALSGIGLGRTFELGDPTTMIDFGYVENGQTGQVQLAIVNEGNKPLADGTITLMPSGAPFTIAPTGMIPVQPTMPTTVTVTCAPTGTGTNAFSTMLTGSATDSLAMPFTVMITCHGTDSPFTATPGTIALGEVSTGSTVTPVTIMLKNHTSSQVTLAGNPALATASTNLTVMPPASLMIPANGAASFELDVDTTMDGDLTNAIDVSDGTHMIEIPISGKVTTPAVTVPTAVALGTFCVGEQTTSSTIALASSGTGTLKLDTPPAMMNAPSPFGLALKSPLVYPASLAPSEQATVDVAPNPATMAGDVADSIVWHTNAPAMPMPLTTITATFLDSGAAIAPIALSFGPQPIIIVTPNAQPLTLQNCGSTAIPIDATIHHPFSIDSPEFPMMLMPRETATFTVGFHPTKTGVFDDMLVIQPGTYPQLQVLLSGTGVTGSPGDDAGSSVVVNPKSFYSCGCTSNDPRGGWPAVVVIGVLVRRRRSR